MKKLKKGDWIFQIHTNTDYRRYERGWRLFSLAIGLLRAVPEEGEYLVKGHVKGLVVRFAYWLPVESF